MSQSKHWVVWAWIGATKSCAAEWMPSIKLYSRAQVAEWIATHKAEQYQLVEVISNHIDLDTFLEGAAIDA